MYSDTSGLTGIRAVIGASSILLVASLALASYILRPLKRDRIPVAWYAVSLASICLVGLHAAGIAAGAVAWQKGPGPTPYPWQQYHLDGWRDRGVIQALFKTMMATSGLYSILVVVACRATFYQIIAAPASVFRQHSMAKWIMLSFDVLVAVGSLITWFMSLAMGSPCCEGSNQSAADIVIGGIFDEFFTFGFHFIIACGFINAMVAAFLARKWTRQHSLNIPIAESMFSAVWPALLLQTLLLIALTAVYFDGSIEKDVVVFYVSIPWRAQQVVVLGVLAWVVRSLSFDSEDGTSTPLQAPSSTKESA